MKKLFALTAVAVVAITGCANQNTKHPDAPHHHDGKMHAHHHHGHHHKHHDKHGKPHHPQHYACDANATVQANYNPDADNVQLSVTAPSWNLTNQALTLNAAPTASGMRFVNGNDANSFEWHVKDPIGMLTVKTGGQEHTLNCELTAPVKPTQAKS